MVFFQNFCHSYFLWENLVSQNQKFAKLNEIWSRGTLYMLISTLTFIFSKFFSFILFCQIWSQNVKFFKLTEMSYFDVYFFKILIIHIFGLIWSHKLKFSILTEIWCSSELLYISIS